MVVVVYKIKCGDTEYKMVLITMVLVLLVVVVMVEEEEEVAALVGWCWRA